MRFAPLPLCFAVGACVADPVLLPDAGPCGGACGAGTVCEAGRCVTVDGGAPDVPAADAPAADVGADAGALDAAPTDAGRVDAGHPDAGVDLGPPDVLPAGCTSATAGNCCGVACPAGAHATAVCAGGACGVACEFDYADCDGNAANGCEVARTTDDANCGSCGSACAMGTHCANATCRCAAREVTCGGRCTNTQTDAANCGGCNAPCAAGRECRGGACVAPIDPNACFGTCATENDCVASCGAAGGGGRFCCDRGRCVDLLLPSLTCERFMPGPATARCSTSWAAACRSAADCAVCRTPTDPNWRCQGRGSGRVGYCVLE